MRVLFCHDGPLRKDSVGTYYGMAHNDRMFRRYFQLGDEIEVLIRVNPFREGEKTDKYSALTLQSFSVTTCPNIATLSGQLRRRKEAKSVIKEAVERCDRMVVRLPSLIGFEAIKYAKKLGKPYIIELVTCPWDSLFNHSLKGKLVAPFSYRHTKQVVKEASHVVYVTNQFLQKRYPTLGQHTNCSNVIIEEVCETVKAKRLEKIQGMTEEDTIVIGTTAAVNVKFKGQQYVIEALGRLKEQGYTNYAYHLVGGGDQSYLKSIAKQHGVEDQVVFLGPLKHSEVFGWLESIDLYVQPSRQEGLPRALIEAMSRGIPSFGARTAGIPELLEPVYIFSNTKTNTEEICNILRSYTKDSMAVQASRNFEEAKQYRLSVIEARRQSFFEAFKDDK